MSYDPYDAYNVPGYGGAPDPYGNPIADLDGLGDSGLAGYGASYPEDAYRSMGNDGLGLSALDSYGAAGMYDDPLSSGVGGLSLGNDLDGLGAGGIGGYGSGYDSGYGSGIGSGLSGDFGIPEVGGNFLGSGLFPESGYEGYGDPGLGLDALASNDLGDYALGLGSGYDSYGGVAGGLDGGYAGAFPGGLDDMAATGYGNMGIPGSIDSLGLDGLGAGSAHMANYNLGFDNIGSGLNDLGWSSYDSGLGYDGSSHLGDAALLGGAALAGGTLGAGAAQYGSGYGDSHYGSGLGGLDYGGSNLFGATNYDPNLGVLGSSAFSYGAYDGYGYGSGLGSPTLRYSDLASYENRLLTDQAISQAERQSLLADRMNWEALDDSARLAKWSSWDDGYRNRLGVGDGYWGQRYGRSLGSGFGGLGNGSSMYDPMYAAYGWSQPSSSNYTGYDYSYGYGAPSFYSTNTLSSVPYGLTSPVQRYYGDYLDTTNTNSLPYWSDDSRWREAADLAYYQQRLAADRALSEAERMRRWQQRLQWEALDEAGRSSRWAQMAEDQREQMGLGLIGSYAGARYSSRGYGMQLPYELPSQLRRTFSPYMSGDLGSNAYMDSNYARYSDLATWANALKYDRKLAESERLARWRQRMGWEMLAEAEKRARWNQMAYKDKAMLGLAGGFYDSTYGLSNFYDPRALRPMRFPVSTTLARMFSPYKSKAFLARALREGQEDALAFADLVAFENALRADRRLRAEDKLRRWKARIRWQEMNERERRLRYFQMQEAERRMLGLGLSSFFGRRYAAPIMLNGVRGLPPPRAALPMLRAPLPDNLRTVYAPVMARQPMLSASRLSRANVQVDPAKDLADRIRLSLASKTEQLPGISPAQRLAATEQKRRILREMDNDRSLNQEVQISEEQRLRRLRSLGY